MLSLARVASMLVAASVALAPAAAFAGQKGSHEKMQLPMKAEQFKPIVEKRIAKIESVVDKHLAKAKVSDDKRATVKKELEAGVAEIRAAATKAEADGTVTKEEAKAVREAEHKLHAQMQEELHLKKHPKHAKK